jgi:hypothetical protein
MHQSKCIVNVAAWCVLVALSGPAVAQQAVPVIAVFGIEDAGRILNSHDRESLTAYLGTRLAEDGKYRLIPQTDLRLALRKQKKESYKACFDQQCQIEIGRELAAQLTLNTRVARLGSNCLVTATIYNLQTAASYKSATARGGCAVNDIVTSLEKVVATLRGEKPVVVKQPPPPKPAAPPPKRPSGFLVLMRDAGIITLYTFGGLSSVAGIALIGVGLGTEDNDFLYGGIPALVGGVGLIMLAYWITPDDDSNSALTPEESSRFAIIPGLNGISVIGRF